MSATSPASLLFTHEACLFIAKVGLNFPVLSQKIVSLKLTCKIYSRRIECYQPISVELKAASPEQKLNALYYYTLQVKFANKNLEELCALSEAIGTVKPENGTSVKES